MKNTTHPNEYEKAFLDIAYNRFLDIYKEINNEIYWQNSAIYRFSRQKEIFFVYSEISKYEPIKHYLNHTNLNKIGQIHLQHEFFNFLRNIFAHFAFFDTYNYGWISKQLVNWNKESRSIDRFIKNHISHEAIKYRIWDNQNKKLTYLKITFPNKYDETKYI